MQIVYHYIVSVNGNDFVKCMWIWSLFKMNQLRIFYNLAFCFFSKTLQASSDSCHISRTTVQIVTDCPNSEVKWKQAAARKNCEAYASQCSEPEKLEYHCVINQFINETLEVCAYAQNIVLGKLFVNDWLNSNWNKLKNLVVIHLKLLIICN